VRFFFICFHQKIITLNINFKIERKKQVESIPMEIKSKRYFNIFETLVIIYIIELG